MCVVAYCLFVHLQIKRWRVGCLQCGVGQSPLNAASSRFLFELARSGQRLISAVEQRVGQHFALNHFPLARVAVAHIHNNHGHNHHNIPKLASEPASAQYVAAQYRGQGNLLRDSPAGVSSSAVSSRRACRAFCSSRSISCSSESGRLLSVVASGISFLLMFCCYSLDGNVVESEFSAMRNLAERLRGFSACSCAEGKMTLLFMARHGVSLRP